MDTNSQQANRKRNRTAKLDNRDKRDQLPAIGPELAVSGSDSAVPLSQDPAKAREFLGWSRVAGAKSLQPQTGWRREWDSNPRYPSGYTRSPGACLQPLGHLSEKSRFFFTRAGLEAAPPQAWRRGRDSNPRWVSPHTPLAGERLQPLGHLSEGAEDNAPRLRNQELSERADPRRGDFWGAGRAGASADPGRRPPRAERGSRRLSLLPRAAQRSQSARPSGDRRPVWIRRGWPRRR